MSKMYQITPLDEGVSVVMPGLVDDEGGVWGTTDFVFPSVEAAQNAISSVQDDLRTAFEISSLSKYNSHFLSVSHQPDDPEGEFHVTVPYTMRYADGRGGGLPQRRTEKFASWDDAKRVFRSYLEGSAQDRDGNLLTLNVSESETMAFSEFTAFDPQTAPTDEIYPIPEAVQTYLGYDEAADLQETQQFTYAKTIAERSWQSEMFGFVKDYISKEGAAMAEDLGIKDLKTLTPRQAAELSSRIVMDLTAYSVSQQSSGSGGMIPEDDMSALEILKAGRREKGNKDWQGNGICRNFASSVRAVFESLKACQTGFSQLHNTYCAYTGEKGAFGEGGTSFMPRRDSFNSMSMSVSSGHAWNTFFTVSKTGQVDASVIDVTWVDRNLVGMAQVERLDHTATRMQPIVEAISQNLDPDAPDYENQVKAIAHYYGTHLQHLSGMSSQFAIRERAAFTAAALRFGSDQKGFYAFPKVFVKNVVEGCKALGSDISRDEIDALHHICKASPNDAFDVVLRSYMDDKSAYGSAMYVCFQDDDLQKRVLSILRERDHFERDVKKEPRLHARLLETHPELYDGFDPTVDPGDASAFALLVSNQAAHYRPRGELSVRYGHPASTDQVEKIIDHVRHTLRDINPEVYAAHLEQENDYYVVGNFKAFKAALEKRKLDISLEDDSPDMA